jgi:hypothetical protein
MMGLLIEFKTSHHKQGTLNIVTNSIAQSIQQGKELLESSAEIFQANLRIFQILHDIQLLILEIPGQVQHQQPVYFTDPLNRVTPFYLEFVMSAEALIAVLKLNLKESGCGPAMIDRGEFVIEEMGTQNKIDIQQSWNSCFYPGQKVAMSMIFKLKQDIGSSCPRCGTQHDVLMEKEISW